MAIIPTVRCSNMKASLAFYTSVLDFEHIDGDDDLGIRTATRYGLRKRRLVEGYDTFDLSSRVNILAWRRFRARPTTPASPVPSRSRLTGSGTAAKGWSLFMTKRGVTLPKLSKGRQVLKGWLQEMYEPPPTFKLSIGILPKDGKRTQHGIPLEKIRILGRTGVKELLSWMKEWLKIKP